MEAQGEVKPEVVEDRLAGVVTPQHWGSAMEELMAKCSSCMSEGIEGKRSRLSCGLE